MHLCFSCRLCLFFFFFFFFFNDTATTEIYTLSLHDALPICRLSSARPYLRTSQPRPPPRVRPETPVIETNPPVAARPCGRSEEHTSELQSQSNLVCRLLLEKKKKKHKRETTIRRHYKLHSLY